MDHTWKGEQKLISDNNFVAKTLTMGAVDGGLTTIGGVIVDMTEQGSLVVGLTADVTSVFLQRGTQDDSCTTKPIINHYGVTESEM